MFYVHVEKEKKRRRIGGLGKSGRVKKAERERRKQQEWKEERKEERKEGKVREEWRKVGLAKEKKGKNHLRALKRWSVTKHGHSDCFVPNQDQERSRVNKFVRLTFTLSFFTSKILIPLLEVLTW
eukprot:CAMPEP_0201511940 /NCGR_PEP_ID=MMETSP0161_2-20130828/4286_1 /ASSEMBLY_ACC=CAM_ASM_000251 /TAXON_ID=180227 /ORGANISM="Neoparamoeba aestuarina, Strain SoJaBio B1-5/56/2" /LENGTH=124 /DNA_ID=CAMNT_0047907615 /DNA_START=222 /DNA_END=596 /DNA_ORIENTATION=+